MHKRIKYLGIHLTKKVKDPYTENYKTLIKIIKKTQISGKVFHIYGLDELVWLKMSINILKPSTK